MAVLNKRVHGVPPGAVYIGRPSKWGNPFAITPWQNREDVIRLYEQWLMGQPHLVNAAMLELKGKDLVCWCAPDKCHGDILNQLVNTGVTKMAGQNFLSPELRFVQGDCFVGKDKDMQGNPKKDKQGNPVTTWMVAGAGRKGDPAVEQFKASIEAFARAGLPQFFNGATCTHPNFSFKIIDGDGVDQMGKPNNQKPGFAGHWVFKFSSNYAPRCFKVGAYAPQDQLIMAPGMPNPIPRGHYFRIAGSMDVNPDPMKPGVYVNLGMVEWCRGAPGDVIVTGPDAAAVFGGGAPAAAPAYSAPSLPPAAAPVSYQVSPALAAQGHTLESLRASGHADAVMLAQGWIVAAAPAPVLPPAAPALPPAAPALPPAAPAPLPVQPHYAALNAAPAPLVPAGSVLPPPAPAPTAVANGGAPAGFRMANPAGPTYQAYIASNWTDAMLVQNGHMVPA